MCTGSRPKAPAPPPAVAEAPTAPETPVTQRTGAADDSKRRRAAAGGGGAGSTVLTGARGVQDGAATGKKTLLGA